MRTHAYFFLLTSLLNYLRLDEISQRQYTRRLDEIKKIKGNKKDSPLAVSILGVCFSRILLPLAVQSASHIPTP